MYIQITTKCNMTCQHCCYTCGPKGKHMTRDTWQQALSYAAQCSESVAIGGGEPTCHPEFFDILKQAMDIFYSVWLATNGKKTKAMYRLMNIINNEDFYFENEYDTYGQGIPNFDDKLDVALSLDEYHEPIDQKIETIWRQCSENTNSHFQIRNSTRNGVIAAGRAKNWGKRNDCACATIMITPNGNIKMCGCKNAPIIGDIWTGEDEKWHTWAEKHDLSYSGCYNETLRRIDETN
jgi:organic radical activating enzyme